MELIACSASAGFVALQAWLPCRARLRTRQPGNNPA